jgi:hypothetical protein
MTRPAMTRPAMTRPAMIGARRAAGLLLALGLLATAARAQPADEALAAIGSGSFDATRRGVEQLALSGNPRAAAIIGALQDGTLLVRADHALFIRTARERVSPRVAVWRPDVPLAALPEGRVLRIDLPDPARIRWTDDGWARATDTPTVATGLGLHVAELPVAALPPGGRVVFTWQSLADGAWAGRDFTVPVIAAAAAPATLEAAAAGG